MAMISGVVDQDLSPWMLLCTFQHGGTTKELYQEARSKKYPTYRIFQVNR